VIKLTEEGQLYKKLEKAKWEHDSISLDDLAIVFDEAKKDFLKASNTDPNYVTINRNEIAILEWFEKWFGKAGN
jgi:hypothetical protein